MFARHFSTVSKLIKTITTFIYHKWAIKLLDFGQNQWFTVDLQKEMANLVAVKGAPLNNCIGFIDGTAREICRPGKIQRELYSGHKRKHCLKFQSITLPNGIILHMSNPYPGRRHDAFILRDTAIHHQLQNYCQDFCVYGDHGYPLRPYLIRPYPNTTKIQQQQLFNKRMSEVRECVEWSFGKIVQQFAFIDFSKNQKLFLQPVGMYFAVATLLCNAHTCIYGSQTSTYFNIESPSIVEYFN
ncbi:hypothetical protein CHUAL_014103 [Chamberlinius hualienensis]